MNGPKKLLVGVLCGARLAILVADRPVCSTVVTFNLRKMGRNPQLWALRQDNSAELTPDSLGRGDSCHAYA